MRRPKTGCLRRRDARGVDALADGVNSCGSSQSPNQCSEANALKVEWLADKVNARPLEVGPLFSHFPRPADDKVSKRVLKCDEKVERLMNDIRAREASPWGCTADREGSLIV